ncbi:nucleoporin Nup120/160-domain-containing protein [Aspergillus spinulosporus]
MARIYKDTQVDLRPYSPSTIVNIPIPTQTGSQNRARLTISSLTDFVESTAKDEDEFARRYIATQGSVYFRKRNVYPRAFLWRVVNESKVLEIQCVDLTKGGIENHEYNITLRLDFQERILPSGVALADLEDHDVLNLFVITASKELHTLALRPEFFRKQASIDQNISDWCKSYIPAPLAFSYPHRLYASSPLELFISLDSGALLRLTRRAADDGSNWSPLTLDERTWGASLRGLVRWNAQTSVKYDGRTLDANVANAVAATSDQTYVFAVCLNHTLKIWNLATNKLVATKDLLGREIQQNSLTYSLNPAESSFIRVFNVERALDGGYRYYAVTYSPFEDGCFKFWAIKGGLTTPLEIEDLFPAATLRPLDPDSTGNMFWSIADFQVKPAEEGKRMELWVLWRNSGLYQLYTLHFNFESLVSDWANNWTTAVSDTRRQELPPPSTTSDVVDPTEKWLKYLLQPNRFPTEVLETSLTIYQEALKPLSSSSTSKKSAPLVERLCSTFAATVSLRKFEDDDMDFSRYRSDTDSKWRQFWQIADDLNKKRFEPLTLSYDAYCETPWVLLSDSCAVVRECSSTELLLHNPGPVLRSEGPKIADRWRHRNLESELGDLFEETSHLMTVASSFRKRFSADLDAACQSAIEAEIFAEPSSSVQDRMEAFRDRCDFSEQISNQIYNDLISEMNEKLNIYMLSSDIFFKILGTIPLGFPGKDSDLLPTHFGVKVTVNGVQETIQFTRQILIDLLVLVVFIDAEVEQDKRSTFDAVELFVELVTLLREYEMMLWLSSNMRKETDKFSKAVDSPNSSFSLTQLPSSDKGARITTILEDLFATDIKPRQAIGLPQSYILTLGIQDVLSWVSRPGEVAYPNALVYIQCDLIAKGNIELAWDFLRFQPSTSWSTYVKGRLYVAMSELDTAALYFRKAAYLLSCGKPLGNLHEMSSTLLDIVSVDCFHNGLPKYFQHVLSIFEQVRAFSHVSEFASLALQALASEHGSEQDAEVSRLRNDLLSRLFYASLQTCQFDQAYSALSRYKDPALQKSALNSLITSILAASGPGSAGLEQILAFPTTLIPNLASHVDEILVSLAQKQPSSTPFDAKTKWTEGTVDYQRILQAYRIKRGDYRGAAEVAYQNVERLRQARDTSTHHLLSKAKAGDPLHHILEEDDPESNEIRHELLSLINLLACVDKSEAYILVDKKEARSLTSQSGASLKTGTGAENDDENVFMDDADEPTARHGSISNLRFLSGKPSVLLPPPTSPAQGPRRRVIVTLDHLRREYQSELDRVSRIERGDWEFGLDDGVSFDLERNVADNVDTMPLA